MPTNLGALASNLPAPTADVQRGYGGWTGNTVEYYNGWGAGSPITDFASGGFRISVTPTHNCYWMVEAQVMVIEGTSDGNWHQSHFGIRITPADADGIAHGANSAFNTHPALTWNSFQWSYMFRLWANTTYTAYISFEYSNGWYQVYHCNPIYTHLTGVLVAEGSSW